MMPPPCPAPVTLIPITLFHFFLFFLEFSFVFHKALLLQSVFILKIKIKQAFILLLHGHCFIFFMACISL